MNECARSICRLAQVFLGEMWYGDYVNEFLHSVHVAVVHQCEVRTFSPIIILRFHFENLL